MKTLGREALNLRRFLRKINTIQSLLFSF